MIVNRNISSVHSKAFIPEAIKSCDWSNWEGICTLAKAWWISRCSTHIAMVMTMKNIPIVRGREAFRLFLLLTGRWRQRFAILEYIRLEIKRRLRGPKNMVTEHGDWRKRNG